MTVTESSADTDERPVDRTAAARALLAERGGDGAGRSSNPAWKRQTHSWARWLHVYTSMIALLLTLFFGITGITLNHPTWTFGSDDVRTSETGTLEFSVTADDGSIDYLAISEYVRATYDVKGSIDSYDTVNGEVTMAYKNPGYSADVFVEVETGEYEVVVDQAGWVAVMNDLHKGRDSGSAWKWAIDISAGFLVLISVTGLVMQFFLRKRRRSALTLAVVGGIASILLMWFTLS